MCQTYDAIMLSTESSVRSFRNVLGVAVRCFCFCCYSFSFAFAFRSCVLDQNL
jgi:hypothetical protein